MIALLGWTLATAAEEGALSDEAYRFCHEDGFDAEHAREWCALLEQVPPERCPGLRATCDGAQDPGRGCEAFGQGEGRSDGLAGAARPPRRSPEGCGQDLDAPSLEGLQAALRWALAMGVAVVVLVLARLLFRSFGRGRRGPTLTSPLPPTTPEELPTDIPEAPSADQLSAARAAFQAGRFGDAVVLARGAALRALGERGRLKLHRSRTDREYARSVRGDPEVGPDVAEVVGAHERLRFGGAGADRALAERALSAAARLLGVTLGLLLLPLGARAETRYDANGDAALLQVLQDHGYDAGYRLRSLTDLDQDTDVLVLDLAGVVPDAEQWAAVRAWVEAGGVLVVGGDAGLGFPELGTRGFLVDQSLQVVVAEPFRAALPAPVWADGPFAWWEDGEGRALVESPGIGPVVQLLDLGPGVVVAIADARLLWNGAFVSPDNEAFVGDLVYAGQQLEGWPVPTPARVQLATAGAAAEDGGSPDPLRSMARARLLPFVLQLVLAWIVLAVWRGWPFAPLRDPPEERGERFVEHVEALGTHWARSRSSGFAARAWAGLWLSRLGPGGLQSAAVRSGRTREEAAAFAAEVERRAAGDGSANDPGDHAWMEELWRVTRSGRS